MSNYPSRLNPDDIKYLALEGGGGKGNAYVGALESLSHPSLNIIRHLDYRLTNIKGVAGASAGAITSLFLASGFTPFELKTILELEDFNSFFDAPNPGRVFCIGGFRTLPPSDQQPLQVILTSFVYEVMCLCRDLDMRQIATYVAGHVRREDILRNLQKLQDLLISLPDSSADAAEIARRVQELVLRLAHIGAEDIFSAMRSIRALFTIVPPRLWNRLVRLSTLFNQLIRMRTSSIVVGLLFMRINIWIFVIRGLLTNETYQQLLNRDIQATATAFTQDFGMMTGEAIYNFFRRWLAVARLRVNNPDQYREYLVNAGNRIPACFETLKNVVESGSNRVLNRYRDDNMTFEDFEREFQIKLAFTGTNLESLTSHVFSGATTPRFYVVDAVRLSMALPYCIFKPLIIRENDPILPQVLAAGESIREVDPVSNNMERHSLIGVWVDGGLFNNIPSHIFDKEAEGETLSLRLDSSFQEMPDSVTDITDYFLKFPLGLAFGSGEALATRSYDNKYRSIALDTGNLNLLSFSPSPEDAEAVRRSAIQYVFRYFNRQIPQDLQD